MTSAFFFFILLGMSKSRLPIYEGILCLEVYTPNGRKWWDQGYDLGYTPYKITDVKKAKFGRLEGGRYVVAVEIENHGWVAVNPPRSDVPAMEKAGLWPGKLAKPYTEVSAYKSWPDSL